MTGQWAYHAQDKSECWIEWVAPNRLAIAKAFAAEKIEADVRITGVLVGGSTARRDGAEHSDVDVRLVVAGPGADQIAGKDCSVWREGLLVDAGYDPAAKYTSAQDILTDPYVAGFVRDALILYDKDGTLAGVQETVAGEFMQPKWLRARLERLAEPIERNGRGFESAISEGRHAEACRAAAFALWTACDALLVKEGVSPSWVRGLQKVGQVLPAERERVIEVEGTEELTPREAEAFLPLFRQAVGENPGMVMAHAHIGVLWMIRNGLHREGLHSLWASFGLGLRRLLTSADQSDHDRAESLARDWLCQLAWTGSELELRRQRLSAYVRHILTLIGSAWQ